MGIRDWFKSGKQSETLDLGIKVAITPIEYPSGLDYLFIEAEPADILRGLDGWSWLPMNGLTAIAVSAFGEVFFQDDKGAVHQIDTIEGKLNKVSASLGELSARLQNPEERDNLLLEGLIIGARNRGLLPAQGECYDFTVAPILSGPMAADNLEVLSLVVKLHIAGQLHEQVKDLPHGTQINGFSISD